MQEYNIEVDYNDKGIGLRPREDFYTGKYIHRASHLILQNTKGEILLQKRARDKKWYPGLYTFSVSGTVGDESYEECIQKEMGEEIGIHIPVTKLFTYPVFDDKMKSWNSVYLGYSNETITIDKREMDEVVWKSREAIVEDIQHHPRHYTPVFVKGIKMYFSE